MLAKALVGSLEGSKRATRVLGPCSFFLIPQRGEVAGRCPNPKHPRTGQSMKISRLLFARCP